MDYRADPGLRLQPGEQPAFLDPFDASQAFDAEVL